MIKQQLVVIVNKLVHTNGFGEKRVTRRKINRAYHWILKKGEK